MDSLSADLAIMTRIGRTDPHVAIVSDHVEWIGPAIQNIRNIRRYSDVRHASGVSACA